MVLATKFLCPFPFYKTRLSPLDYIQFQIIKRLYKEPFWNDLNRQQDGLGRTPVLSRLNRGGNSCAAGEVPTQQGQEHKVVGGLEANLNALLGVQGNDQMQRSHLTMHLTCSGGSGDGSDHTDTLTGLMHAARGGQETFELACGMIAVDETSPHPALQLYEALGLDSPIGNPDDVSTVLVDKRCGQLLAQATLGGDCVVLDQVTAGIEVG